MRFDYRGEKAYRKNKDYRKYTRTLTFQKRWGQMALKAPRAVCRRVRKEDRRVRREEDSFGSLTQATIFFLLKVPYIVALYRKYTRKLTFQNLKCRRRRFSRGWTP